jgi:DNA-binding MarR family transcriptional regulator
VRECGSGVTEATQDLPARLAEEFGGLGKAYMRWVGACVPNGGPSHSRLRLLGALSADGPQMMSGLSGGLGVTPRNVTALVDALEREGLVRRRAHPTDRRAVLVELTAEGARAASGAYEEHLRTVAGVFGELPPEDQRELLRILSLLQAALRRRGVSRPGAPGSAD